MSNSSPNFCRISRSWAVFAVDVAWQVGRNSALGEVALLGGNRLAQEVGERIVEEGGHIGEEGARIGGALAPVVVGQVGLSATWHSSWPFVALAAQVLAACFVATLPFASSAGCFPRKFCCSLSLIRPCWRRSR